MDKVQKHNSFNTGLWSQGGGGREREHMQMVPKEMSTVRLVRIGWEYRNERYRNISSIFPHQQEHKISACAPLTFPSCTARKWLSPICRFVNVLSLNFLWKRDDESRVTTSIQRPNDKAWNGITPHRQKRKKKQKAVPSAGKVTGTVFWNSEGCTLVDCLEKGKTTNAARYVQTFNKRALRENVRRRKLSSFNMTTRGLTLHVWPCRQFKRTARNSSPIHPAVRIWPPHTTTCSDPWNITWEVATTRLTKQSGKQCEAGCK
jgi:hypothetical protein